MGVDGPPPFDSVMDVEINPPNPQPYSAVFADDPADADVGTDAPIGGSPFVNRGPATPSTIPAVPFTAATITATNPMSFATSARVTRARRPTPALSPVPRRKGYATENRTAALYDRMDELVAQATPTINASAATVSSANASVAAAPSRYAPDPWRPYGPVSPRSPLWGLDLGIQPGHADPTKPPHLYLYPA